MILFTLKCAAGHEFEGWFRDNAAFDRQRSRGQIACPACSGTSVDKALMAPRVGRPRSEAPPAAESRAEAPPGDQPPSPDQVRRALQELRRHIEARCDYVGDGFPAEARRIHRGEARARGIYGEATPAESRALTEEGIEIAAIPWVAPNDA